MPNYTFLLITDRLLARIDLRVRAKITIESLQSAVRPENVSWDRLIATAIALGPKRLRHVWLFSNDFWTGCISIPSDLHGIANSDELKQAAILEAETRSEISAYQSKIAISRISDDYLGDPQYWVTQITESELTGIEQALHSSKVKWEGIAHPATHCLSHHLADANTELELLENESEIRTWAERVVTEHLSKIATFPYFAAPANLITPQIQTSWAVSIALLTIAACTTVALRDRSTLQNIEQLSLNAAKQVEANESLTRDLQKVELSLEEKKKKLQVDQIRHNRLNTELETQRLNQLLKSGHCANLMDAIANSAESESWLQCIESDASQTKLKGFSLNEASAHRFASSLELHPGLAGHTVSPAQIVPIGINLVEFSIDIELQTATENSFAGQELTQ